MDRKNCTTCKNAYIKDFVYLICEVKGMLDLQDFEKSKECIYYETEKVLPRV